MSRSSETAARPPIAGDVFEDVDAAALIQSLSRPFAATTLRSAPVQPRALKTVERILAAGRALGLKLGRPPSLQAVAESAGVTLSAAYRYFSAPEDLVRVLVRMAALRQLTRFRAGLAEARFASASELADMMARSLSDLIRADIHEPDVPHRLRAALIRDYHRLPYEDLWRLAGEVLGAMRRNGLAADDPDAQSRIALAFAAASGVLTMRLAQTGALRDETHVTRALGSIFLTALEPPAGSRPREPAPQTVAAAANAEVAEVW